jgi:hypothetical protein
MKRPELLFLGIALVVAVALATLGIVVVTAQELAVLVKFINGSLPVDPASSLWPKPADVFLTSQTRVFPLAPAVENWTVSVATVYNDTHIAFLLTWKDATQDIAKPGGLDVFPDAVAVQFPASRAQLLYICMGTMDNPVNIAHLRPRLDRAAVLSSCRLHSAFLQVEAFPFPAPDGSPGAAICPLPGAGSGDGVCCTWGTQEVSST